MDKITEHKHSAKDWTPEDEFIFDFGLLYTSMDWEIKNRSEGTWNNLAKELRKIFRKNTPQWKDFSVEKPKDTKAYQVCFENANGIQRTARARYIPANTIKAEDFFSEDALEDMEDPDIFVPEGWYEELWAENGATIITEKVTHYQPLPSLPNIKEGE